MRKKSKSKISVAAQIFLIIMGIIWLYPLYKMIEKSFESYGIHNYTAILSDHLFYTYFLNSAIVAALDLTLTLFTVTLAAYAFSKMKIPFKNTLFLIAIAGLMIPSAAFIVPLFNTLKHIGLINNPLGLVGPHVAFGIPFSLLIMKGFFDEIPDAVLEAATLDGCNKFQIYNKIMIPLSKAPIATCAIFTFLGSWNDYLLPLVILQSPNRMTITLMPQKYMAFAGGSNYGRIYACLVLISIPVFLIYLFGQKYMEKGIMTGTVK